jgi:hypothetical protein
VSWKFWRRKDKDFPQFLSEKIPLSTLIRWYCYDLGIEDVNSLVKEFDLMPVSPEGEEFELERSEERMDNVLPLVPFFEMISAINAKAVSTIQLKEIDTDELEALDSEMMESLYRQVSFAALTAAFSAALEIGFLNKSYGFLALESQTKEEDNDE